MLSFTRVRKEADAKHIVQPIVSLGFPTRLFRSKKRWVLELPSNEAALDAEYVLKKHIEELHPYMGKDVSVAYIYALPNGEHFVSKKVEGRAEN